MLIKKFKTYELSVKLYRQCKTVQVPHYLKEQLMRASSSVSLNLAEGSAKPSRKDRLRFYTIAFASLREVQAILDLEPEKLDQLVQPADVVGACLYKLKNSI